MSMCSDRYADEVPLGFSKYQLPPTSSDASKQVCGTPKSASALQAVSPLTPAPITHTEGSSPILEILTPPARWPCLATDAVISPDATVTPESPRLPSEPPRPCHTTTAAVRAKLI